MSKRSRVPGLYKPVVLKLVGGSFDGRMVRFAPRTQQGSLVAVDVSEDHPGHGEVYKVKGRQAIFSKEDSE